MNQAAAFCLVDARAGLKKLCSCLIAVPPHNALHAIAKYSNKKYKAVFLFELLACFIKLFTKPRCTVIYSFIGLGTIILQVKTEKNSRNKNKFIQ